MRRRWAVSGSEHREADLFWTDLHGISAANAEAVGEDFDAEDMGSEATENVEAPFFGDGPNDVWRVVARAGDPLASIQIRDDDLVVRGRRSLLGRKHWDCVRAGDASSRMVQGFGGHLRPGTVVLRRMAADTPAPGREGFESEQVPPAAPVARYGGYQLQSGDDDATRRWGGSTRGPGSVLPAAGQTGFVRQLQEDLVTLGFAVVGTPNGRFTWQTEWALREFQHCADSRWLAQEQAAAASPPPRYVDRLTSVKIPPSALAVPIVHGWLSADDRSRIELWLRNRWRCPVVVEAWRSADLDANGQPQAGRSPQEQNLWVHTQPAQKPWRVLARDFSQRHDLTAMCRNPEHLRVLGYKETSQKGGPQSVPPNHTWPEAEVTPRSMLCRGLSSLTPDELSTFKVVRAVSETECQGYLDSLNCWDNVILSAGPYHWPIGAPTWSATEPGWNEGGELGGFLAYLRRYYPSAFTRLTDDAIVPEKTWNPADPTFFNQSQRRYHSRLQWRTAASGAGFVTVPLTPQEMSYFKTWRWVYRFQMAARTDPEYRRAMWDYARIRIRDLLATPWGAGLQVGTGAAARPATIGDVFKSERNVAMLVRWHVRYPAHMVSGGHAGAILRAVFSASGITANNPAQWGDPEETQLTNAIIASPRIPDTMSTVHNWPTWTAANNPYRFALDLTSLPVAERTLRSTRGSFRLNAP
jgi:hypothetical protein